jgi:nucleotide-binding universal stress UspA family protein
MKLDRILMPTDFSEASHAALDYALFLAEQHGAALDLLHVVVLHGSEPYDVAAQFPDADEVARRLQEIASSTMQELLAARRTDHLEIREVHRRAITAAPAILDYAADEDVDLIVLGTHGRRGVRRFLLGSVAEEVVRLAPCPVLTIPGKTRPELRPIARIVAPVDYSEPSKSALAAAKELAETYGGLVCAVHVLEPIPEYHPFTIGAGVPVDYRRLTEQAKETLGRLVEEVGGPRVEVETEVLLGSPGPRITEYAEQVEADLIVVATHGHTGLSRLFLGSVAEKVVRLAGCPVLVLRNPSNE